MQCRRNFTHHLTAPYVSNRAISVNNDYQIVYTMPDLGYPPRTTRNEMICYKGRHTLLLKWSISFIGCIRKVRGAAVNIYKALIVHIMPFLQRLTLKLHTTCQIWGTLLSSRRMVCYATNTRRDIHCCWGVLNPALDIWGQWGKILEASMSSLLIVHIMSFLLRLVLKFDTKYKIWGRLSAQKMEWYATRKYIHCC